MKKENKWISGGAIGATIGLIIIRSLLDYIRDNNLPGSYLVIIYVTVTIIALIGAIRLGKKNKKMKNGILLCLFIISFITLYYLLNFIRSSYPQYIHIYKAPIVIGMILSLIMSILLLFSLSDQNYR